MSRDKRTEIDELAKAIFMNCHCGLFEDEAEMIAKWCYQEIERKTANVDGFPCVAYNKKHERYQVIHKGKDGRIFASKFYHTRKDAEIALAELKKKHTEN